MKVITIQMYDLTKMKRLDVVPLYVELIKRTVAKPFSDEVKTFNAMIINRWSNAGLIFIKEHAWKIVRNK